MNSELTDTWHACLPYLPAAGGRQGQGHVILREK